VTAVGVIAIGRPTFDLSFAQTTASEAWALLQELDVDLVGSPQVLVDRSEVVRAAAELRELRPARVIVIQATFADSTLALAAAEADSTPVLWAFPEPRSGGRLRLNSLCGINLAAFALTEQGVAYGWLYGDPAEARTRRDLERLLEQPPSPRPPITTPSTPADGDTGVVEATLNGLQQSVIGLVGEHPEGFEPCAYEPALLAELTGATVDRVELGDLFDRAAAVDSATVDGLRSSVSANLAGVETLDEVEIDRSLRLHAALSSLTVDRTWSAVATRCWPECFTEFGGAACAPMAMLNEGGTPGCCEADVYGALTSLVLKSLAGGPAFVADLVDIDREANTVVLWHCGLAPLGMAGSAPRATVHSNRQKPLLHEFSLRPGQVTLARVSRSRGIHRLVIGGGEMLDEPLAFSGTAGVLRVDEPVDALLATVMGEGLEHHFGVVYGDVRRELETLAAQLGIAVVML
jgi:L-fucose isomerase-like protein